MAAISRGQGRLKSNRRTRCPLPIGMPLPSLARITIIDLEKRTKMLFQTIEVAVIFQGQGRLRSYSRLRCPLPLAMPLPSFAQITRIDLEKSAKM